MPIRVRLTLLTAALMALLLLALGGFLYVRLKADLFHTVDLGLRSRAQVLRERLSLVPLREKQALVEVEDAFAQVLRTDGQVLASSAGLTGAPLVSRNELAELARGPEFFNATVRAGEEQQLPARLLVVPVAGGRAVVVGASVEDQQEALAQLLILFAAGGPVAVALASAVGWVVAGGALRPVERMRAEAESVSASEPGRRLPVPATSDELARLGATLNGMLARLEEAIERERRFVGDASHELRTPLANLKAELELALRRSRTAGDLEAAIRSAAEETDRLTRLAEDLLILARAGGGRLVIHREDVDVSSLVGDVIRTFSGTASQRGVSLGWYPLNDARANLDPIRIRQALGNLLDNAVRHTPSGGRVDVEVSRQEKSTQKVTPFASPGAVSIEVIDSGEGFPESFLPHAFEPFSRADAARTRSDGGAGLGLAIVKAVAEAHGGSVQATNRPGRGAVVVLRLPA